MWVSALPLVALILLQRLREIQDMLHQLQAWPTRKANCAHRLWQKKPVHHAISHQMSSPHKDSDLKKQENMPEVKSRPTETHGLTRIEPRASAPCQMQWLHPVARSCWLLHKVAYSGLPDQVAHSRVGCLIEFLKWCWMNTTIFHIVCIVYIMYIGKHSIHM